MLGLPSSSSSNGSSQVLYHPSLGDSSSYKARKPGSSQKWDHHIADFDTTNTDVHPYKFTKPSTIFAWSYVRNSADGTPFPISVPVWPWGTKTRSSLLVSNACFASANLERIKALMSSFVVLSGRSSCAKIAESRVSDLLYAPSAIPPPDPSILST